MSALFIISSIMVPFPSRGGGREGEDAALDFLIYCSHIKRIHCFFPLLICIM